MATLYLTRIQPNPPGRDVVRPGWATPDLLNGEWVEMASVSGARNLAGDVLQHNTYTSSGCSLTGQEVVLKFGTGELNQGQSIRLHTGPGADQWVENTFYMFLGRKWFIWNNDCGDRADLSFNNQQLDWASYGPSPREGILTRVVGTNRFT
jgi:hypothetical protein